VSLKDAGTHLKKSNVAVVGISPDPVAAQKRFAEKNALDFPLLSDQDHKVALQYGAWGPKVNSGTEGEGILRSSFLIDEEGKISAAWYKISPDATVPELLNALGTAQ
jgi:peroxiredoxin